MRKLFILIILFGFTKGIFAENIYKVEDNTLILPYCIKFENNGYDLTDSSKVALDYVANYLKEQKYITKFRIESHVFDKKTSNDNIAVSLQRSAIIAYYLTERGIDCKRLVVTGFGDTKPIQENNPENYVINSRTSFCNAALNNNAIGGIQIDGFAIKSLDPCEN